MTHRHASLAATCIAGSSRPFEALEHRRLLSASALDNPVVTMDWNGRSVKAEAGEYILSLKPGTRLVAGRNGGGQVAAVQRALAGRAGTDGFVVEEYLGNRGAFLLDVPRDRTYSQVRDAVDSLRGFSFVEPNFVFQIEKTPNDPFVPHEYALNNTGSTPLGASKADADMDAVEAWDITTGSAGVVVGVVDSGVDYTHPDLAPNMWRNPFEVPGNDRDDDNNGYVDDVHGIDAAANTGNPMDENGHGTHVAGTIAAAGNNALGVAGVSWDSKVMALKFLTADGSGSTADAIECLNYAVSMRNKGVNIRLTNNSWGGGGFETALHDAIARTNSAGMLFVAAAGNGGDDGVGDNNDTYGSFPSNHDLPNVVAVAATDRFDALAGFSNYGARTVDLAAPGVDIASTYFDAGYVFMSGTSMATPNVSGVAALAWSHKPGATVSEVRTALLSGVDKVDTLSGKVLTGGRVNALNTLRLLGNSLSGVAYDDADGDGSRGGAEAALAGRTVWLDLDNDASIDAGEPSRQTDAVGNYRFGGLVPGTYAVRQGVPSGWTGTAPGAGHHTVTVADGQDYAGVHFGSRVTPVVTDSNDQLAEAFAVSVGSGATGSVGDGDLAGTDVDLFSFNVVAGQRVGFDVDQPAGGTLDSYLRLFNAAGAPLAVNDDGAAPGETAGTSSYLEYTFATAGTYYFGVSGSANTAYNAVTGGGDVAGSVGSYSVELVNQTVGTDPDDQLGEATALPVGAMSMATASISDPRDVDMYAITLSAGQRVAIDIDRTAGSTLDSYLRLFDAAGGQLAYNDNGAAPGEALSPASYLHLEFSVGGTYYFGVSANPNRGYGAATGNGDVTGRAGGYALTITDTSPLGTASTAATLAAPRLIRPRLVFSDLAIALGSDREALLGAEVVELL